MALVLPIAARWVEHYSLQHLDKRKPSQRIRDIMPSFIQALDNEDDVDVEDKESVCNAVENCINPPNHSAAMKTAAAERWKIAIETT
jgi:hypothetical protein